jgi:hypothetical protein
VEFESIGGGQRNLKVRRRLRVFFGPQQMPLPSRCSGPILMRSLPRYYQGKKFLTVRRMRHRLRARHQARAVARRSHQLQRTAGQSLHRRQMQTVSARDPRGQRRVARTGLGRPHDPANHFNASACRLAGSGRAHRASSRAAA